MYKAGFCVLVVLPTSTFAQAPGPGQAPSDFSIELKVAPNMALTKPYSSTDYTDDTRMTLSFKGKRPLTDDLELSVSFSPSITFDDDKDPPHGSSVGGAVELATRTLKPWQVFASYGPEASFTGRFGDEAGTKGTMKAGLRYDRDDLDFNTGFKLETVGQKVMSSLAGGDYYGFAIEPTLKNKFLSFAHIVVRAGVERRVYEGRDPLVDRKRRDWLYFGLAGLDLAPGLHALAGSDRLEKHVNELTIGYKYAKQASNIDSADKTSHAFVPVINLKIY